MENFKIDIDETDQLAFQAESTDHSYRLINDNKNFFYEEIL